MLESPFLCTEIMFATFRKSGNIPLLKDTLIIGTESSAMNSFDIFCWYAVGANSFIWFSAVN